jgi:type II secretory pathway component GspD/PulD (secretin)
MKYSTPIVALAFVLSCTALSSAQSDATARGPALPPAEIQVFYLHGDPQRSLDEASSSIRQVLGNSHDVVMADYSHNAIIVRASADEIAIAKRMIDDLDHPKKSWRLTYTVSEMDGDKRVGTQHYSMMVASGQQSVLKQGDRVPILTAASGGAGSTTQFVYQDIGMSFSATLDELHEGGARLRSDVNKTGLADEKSGFGQQDPVFRSSELKGEATLLPGKPLILGTMDMPGTTHHLQIEVLMEPLP